MSLCAAYVYKSPWWLDSLELKWQEVVSHLHRCWELSPGPLQVSRAISPVALQLIFKNYLPIVYLRSPLSLELSSSAGFPGFSHLCPLLELGLQAWPTMPSFCVVLELKLRSPCLCNRHFTKCAATQPSSLPVRLYIQLQT